MPTPNHTITPLPADALNSKSPFYNPDRLFDTDTAGQVLDVSINTLSIWRSTGRYNLPFVKIGRKVRYKAGDLLAFIERRTQTQTD